MFQLLLAAELLLPLVLLSVLCWIRYRQPAEHMSQSELLYTTDSCLTNKSLAFYKRGVNTYALLFFTFSVLFLSLVLHI